MNIIKAKDAIKKLQPEGNVINYFLFDDYEVIQTDQPAHTLQEWHHHKTILETLYVVDGEIVVMWKDNGRVFSTVACTGDLIETGRNSHTLKNDSNDIVKLLCFKHLPSGKNNRDIFKLDKIVD